MIDAVCTQCGVEFSARTSQHKTCSADCRKAKLNAYSRWYYQENRGEALTKQKRYYDKWREDNPGKSYYGTEYRLYYGARDRCRKSGVEFNITVDDITIPVLCPVLKVEMVRGGRYAPSLDRIEPAKGYTPDNIQVMSKLANRMKNDSTPEEQRKFAEWVWTLQQSQPTSTGC